MPTSRTHVQTTHTSPEESLFEASPAHPQFPCSPPWWQCCISLPDELDKILVGREGSLLLDYARGKVGHRGFATVIEPFSDDGLRFVSQELLNPKTPVVITKLQSGPVRFEIETFCVTPPDSQFDMAADLAREGGDEVFSGWDGPKFPRIKRNFCQAALAENPEFSNVAWGAEGREIAYHWKTHPGGSAEIVLGFAEGEYATAGSRILQIAVDGAPPIQLDPAQAFGLNRPGVIRLPARDVDGDGTLRISVQAAESSIDPNAFLSAIWIFENGTPSTEEILDGSAEATAFLNCGYVHADPRQVLTRLSLTNTTGEAISHRPEIGVRSLDRILKRGDGVWIGGRTQFLVSCGVEDVRKTVEKSMIQLPAMSLAPGETKHVIITINRHGYVSAPCDPHGFTTKRQASESWWSDAPLPHGLLRVPDARIQALIDSSIRNIYQARDLQNGLPAFHVGPTCYRQLWIVDGAFLLELVTMLGRKDEARAGIEYMLSFQQEDGGFQLKRRYWKEAGIVLWAVVRHARLSQDRDWLKSHWAKLERAVAFIQDLRTREGAGDPGAPDYRLAPWGDCDGGFSNMEPNEGFPEFSNSYWLMSGLKAIAEAADWIGHPDQARLWCAEYESFREAFDAAAAREMRTDAHGNRYLPIIMRGEIVPQRAQWAFCHAVHPGCIFEPHDPFVTGMLRMLEAVEVEGLTYDTGWMSEGLWTYFASFLAHAQLWNGNRRAAFAAITAFADHSSPVLVWREEQKPVGKGLDEVGDMPHNWASAEFIRLVVHLLIFERGNELHLMEGVPSVWLTEGAEIHAHDIVTIFGTISLDVRVSSDRLNVRVTAPEFPCVARVVHLDAWSAGAEPHRFTHQDMIELDLPR